MPLTLTCKTHSHLATCPRSHSIGIPEKAPFGALVMVAARGFGIPVPTAAIITEDGVAVPLGQTAEDVFLRYGPNIRLISRDRVGAA